MWNDNEYTSLAVMKFKPASADKRTTREAIRKFIDHVYEGLKDTDFDVYPSEEDIQSVFRAKGV